MLAPFLPSLPEPSATSQQLYRGFLEELATLPPALMPQIRDWLLCDPYKERRWDDLIKVEMSSESWQQLDLAMGYWLFREAMGCRRATSDDLFTPGWFIQAHELFLALRHRTTSGSREELVIGSKLWHDAVVGGLMHATCMAMDEPIYEPVVFQTRQHAEAFAAMAKDIQGKAALAGLMAVERHLHPRETD